MAEVLEYALYIIMALMILMLMITIHEFGHYIAGKLLKFKINEFAIGFGPKLFSRKKKDGEVFSIRAIPLGGFCAFDGEEFEDDKKEPDKDVFPKEDLEHFSNGVKKIDKSAELSSPLQDSKKAFTNKKESVVSTLDGDKTTISTDNSQLKKFNDQSPWKRIVVLVMGATFNLVSAVVFSFIFLLVVGLTAPKITMVELNPDGVPYAVDAINGEIKEGDIIVAINGERITYLKSFSDISRTETSVFTILRDGQELDFTLTAQQFGDEEVKRFGFVAGDVATLERGFLDALRYCVPYTGKMAWMVLSVLGGLFTGKIPLTSVSGPVGTISAITEASILNWRNIFFLLPLIAANLGVFNLLPIPALDGSKIVFCTIEGIRKKPISRKVEAYIHAAGMLLLFGFVIFIDIFNMFARCSG